jgi:hypothetical protein
MLISAIICFGIAILFGFIMFMYLIQEKIFPRILGLTHGVFAISGIVLLILYALTNAPNTLIVIITLFILAAMGGLTLFYKDITGKSIPKWLAAGHGGLAFATFLFLIIYTFA